MCTCQFCQDPSQHPIAEASRLTLPLTSCLSRSCHQCGFNIQLNEPFLPSSFVFHTQLFRSPPSTSINLSLPKPAFANALTNELARLCLAESRFVNPATLL